MKKAVFPGSFDPVTKGHESIIKRASELFDEVVIAIGENPEKKGFFTIEQRMLFLKKITKGIKNISITSYTGLTVDFCKKTDSKFIVRGLRTAADFDFEYTIAQMNKQMNPEIETVFLLAISSQNAVKSSVVRDILKNKGDFSSFVPDSIIEDIRKYNL
jgi:pantetheine-phosphate adenylyltransferase